MSRESIHGDSHFHQKVRLISRISQSDKDFRFNNLMYLVNEESLRICFRELDKDKTPGVDKVTYAQYEENLEANIVKLVERMKRMGYHPKPVKRTYIPKDNGKLRPLGIPSLEDKLVQQVLCHILSAIFEPDFEDFSYGFRPKRNCHQALARLNHAVMRSPVNYIIDADIKGFFDNVDHDSMRKCLEQRITDRKLLRYLMRFLKSGVMEEGKLLETNRGTPQGGLVSPILANVYLHYALDRWYCRMRPGFRGHVELIRYADDFIFCVQYRTDAQLLFEALELRMRKCHLELAGDKTSLLRFGRYSGSAKSDRLDADIPRGTFNFLGFTHYESKSRSGKFKLGRRTEKKRFARGIKRIKLWLKKCRNEMKLKDIWQRLNWRLRGHYQYYGVNENSHQLQAFYEALRRIIFKWVNRRSQKRSFNWKEFILYLKRYPLAKPRIYHNLYRMVY